MDCRLLPRLPLPDGFDPSFPLSATEPLLLPLPEGEPLDLMATLRCGQAFRWRQAGEYWFGPMGQSSLALCRVPNGVEARATGVPVTAGDAWRFLGLDHGLLQLRQQLAGDRWVAASMDTAPGLRLLRQDPWECTVNFLCSQNSNIPKIELSTERVARTYGTVHRWPEGIEVATLPPPERLANVPCDDLRSTALGYRCRYMVDSAAMVASGEVKLPQLRGLPYAEALAELLRLPGVGRKVADCILLFAMDQHGAFPVDVWVRRVIHELYPAKLAPYLPDAAERTLTALSSREHDALVRLARDRWGDLAGYAQQYLFHARRTNRL